MEGADADVARGGPRLQRVQHVVDLHEVLRATSPPRSPRSAGSLRSGARRSRAGRISVRPSTSSWATALATPAEWVTQTASAIQKPATSGGLADQRSAVRGEGEDPVEALLDLRPAQGGQQPLAVCPRLREVVFGEGQHRRHRGGGDLAVVVDRVQVARASAGGRSCRCRCGPRARGSTGRRPGCAGSVARSRSPRRCARRARRSGRSSRTGGPAAAAARPCRPSRPPRAPEAGARHDDVGRDHPVGGAHAGDPAARLLDADDAGRTLEARAVRFGAPGQGDDRAAGLGQAVGRGVQAAEDALAVEQRVQPDALVGVDDPALDAPGRQPPRRRCRSVSRSGVVATSSPPTS